MADEQQLRPSRQDEVMLAAALLFPGDEVLQAIMAQAHKPARVRFREAGHLLDFRDEHGPA